MAKTIRVKDITSHLFVGSAIKFITIQENGELVFACEFDKYDKEGMKKFRYRKVEYFGITENGTFFMRVY